jgi:DNA end-binding protein Ku
MAPRPVWKGYLKLSLVTCAVEMSGATTQADKVHFRTLNRATGHTVKRQYIDSVTGEPVAPEDEIKGYEVEDDRFLEIEEEELDAVQIESSHTLSLDTFVDKSRIEQIYLDTPYYLTPADEVSEEAFAVIREALEKKKMAGLARVVLYRRERPCVIEPLGKGMLLTTLRYENTVRRPEEILDGVKEVKLNPDMIELAGTIIDKKMGTFDPDKFEDSYENALIELIEAKKSGRKPKAPQNEPAPSNVVNLFEALKKSLANDKGGSGKASGKAEPDKPKPAAKGKAKAEEKPAAKAKPKAGSAASKRKSA